MIEKFIPSCRNFVVFCSQIGVSEANFSSCISRCCKSKRYKILWASFLLGFCERKINSLDPFVFGELIVPTSFIFLSLGCAATMQTIKFNVIFSHGSLLLLIAWNVNKSSGIVSSWEPEETVERSRTSAEESASFCFELRKLISVFIFNFSSWIKGRTIADATKHLERSKLS